MTQICITLPAGPEGLHHIAQAFAAVRVAAVVIVPSDAGSITPDAALPLIAATQKAGGAALIFGDAHLARVLKADGVHLPWSPDIRAAAEDARDILGQGGIVGADAGASRHDAMELGELGVDYVAFGLAAGIEPEQARDDRDDLVSWWAEIFEIPVVALDVAEAEEAAALAAAKADFLSIALSPGEDAGAALAAIVAAVTETSAVPAAV